MAAQAPVVASEPDPVTTPPEAIDFDKMFDDLASEDNPPVVKPVEPAPVEAAAPEPAPAEVEEPELPLEHPPTAEPKPTSDEDILARFAQIVQDRQAREPPQPQQPQQFQQPQQPQAPVEYFSSEEKTALTTFDKDWPDVSKVMAIRERALAQQLVGYVFNEVANTIRPLFSQVGTIAERSQAEQIYALEPEYSDALREKVIDWIGQQPAYLKPAYEYVRDHGTAEEVADLIQRYRQTTGASANSIPARAPVVGLEEPSLPAAAKKAVASLAPVGSKRSVVVQSNDPSNYDAAFETFASSLS